MLDNHRHPYLHWGQFKYLVYLDGSGTSDRLTALLAYRSLLFIPQVLDRHTPRALQLHATMLSNDTACVPLSLPLSLSPTHTHPLSLCAPAVGRRPVARLNAHALASLCPRRAKSL